MPLAAFDLEIAKEVPDDDRDWLRHGPVGISCAALIRDGVDSEPLVMFDPHSSPHLFDPATKAITPHGAGLIVDALASAVEQGFTIVSWNGLGFDFPLLALESGLRRQCVQLALDSIDMMFQLVCVNGYMLSLDTALAGTRLQGKIHTVRLNDGHEAPIGGREAPSLWRAGEYQAVMQYCAGDVRQTLSLALECQRRHCLAWTSRRGKPARMDVGRRWLTVRECMALPEPDTSWMPDPVKRQSFVSWMGEPVS